MTLHRQKDYIMANFDFAKVHKLMSGTVPISNIKSVVSKCIDECIQEKGLYQSKTIPGIEAEYMDGDGRKDKLIEVRYVPVFMNALTKIFDK